MDGDNEFEVKDERYETRQKYLFTHFIYGFIPAWIPKFLFPYISFERHYYLELRIRNSGSPIVFLRNILRDTGDEISLGLDGSPKKKLLQIFNLGLLKEDGRTDNYLSSETSFVCPDLKGHNNATPYLRSPYNEGRLFAFRLTRVPWDTEPWAARLNDMSVYPINRGRPGRFKALENHINFFALESISRELTMNILFGWARRVPFQILEWFIKMEALGAERLNNKEIKIFTPWYQWYFGDRGGAGLRIMEVRKGVRYFYAFNTNKNESWGSLYYSPSWDSLFNYSLSGWEPIKLKLKLNYNLLTSASSTLGNLIWGALSTN
jgi:hypothetical protein